MTDFIEKKIKVAVTGNYILKVPEGEGPFPLFLTFHGYSGNAKGNIPDALKIPGTENWIVCAVEALSHYHAGKNDDGSPKAGGCWITFQDADQTVQEIVDYIDSVIDEVRNEYSCTDKLVYMGFSQGTIPAWAMSAYGKHKASGTIAVGYHMFSKLETGKLEGLPCVLLGRGDRDPHFPEDKMEENKQTLEELGVKVATSVYDAAHDWHPDFFQTAGIWLGKV